MKTWNISPRAPKLYIHLLINNIKNGVHMRSNRTFLFAATALVIIAAGCVGTGGKGNVAFDQHAGVRIEQFSSDMTELYDNEPITLSLKVANVGSKTMTGDSLLWIYGPQFGNGTAVWSATNLPVGASVSNGYVEKTLTTKDFIPPNVERGIPGSIDVTDITFTAPDVPENMRREDDFYARVCYPYQTQSLTKLVATTRNQLRQEPMKKTDAVTRASAGPIQLRMASGQNLLADRLEKGSVPVVFEITDVGGGFATLSGTCTGPDFPAKDMNQVNFTVTIDGVATDCAAKTVILSKGVGGAACRVAAGALTATAAPKTEFTVTATADYNYYLTRQEKVTVLDENL